MNGPLEYGHELSKSFEFSGDDSQFIKIDATTMRAARAPARTTSCTCATTTSGPAPAATSWSGTWTPIRAALSSGTTETDYSYEHSMTFESSDGGCAARRCVCVSQPCFECVYHVHSCNRASDMGVHTAA